MGLSQKHKDYLRAWGPITLTLGVAIISFFWVFPLFVALFYNTGWPGVPIVIGIAMTFLSVYVFVERTLPEHTLTRRKWGNINKTSHKRELKALKRERRKYVGYMRSHSGSDRETYYRMVINVEKKIGDLTGRGYDMPLNEPSKKATSHW